MATNKTKKQKIKFKKFYPFEVYVSVKKPKEMRMVFPKSKGGTPKFAEILINEDLGVLCQLNNFPVYLKEDDKKGNNKNDN